MSVEDLRERIDGVDDRILDLVEERVELAKRIGKVKREEGLPIQDTQREGEIVGRLTGKTNLRKDFVRRLYEHIIGYCRENE
jgi:chorismate mutase